MTTPKPTADDPREQAARALRNTLGDALTDGCRYLRHTALAGQPEEKALFVLFNVLIDTAGRYGAAVIQENAGLAPAVRAAADNLVAYLAPTTRQ